jgi:hypothetical protein
VILGGYGRGREALPRVVSLSVARYREVPPEPGEPSEFLVSLHEEGTAVTWQQNVTLAP